MSRSKRGLVWVMLEWENKTTKDREDEVVDYEVPRVWVRQFLYNAAAAERCGLDGVDVGMRYDSAGEKQEVHLLWQGVPINFTKK